MPSPFSSPVRYLGRPQGMQITSRFSPSLPSADDVLDVHQALAVMNRSQLDGRESDFNFSGAGTARISGWKFIYKKLSQTSLYVWG